MTIQNINIGNIANDGTGGQWNSSTLNAQAGGSGSIKTSASFHS